MKRNLFAFAAAISMTAALFSGCASASPAPAPSAPAAPAASAAPSQAPAETAPASKAPEGKPTELVISTFGLNEDALRASLLEPFEKEHNVKIVLEVGNNAERLAKLKNNPNSNIDLMYLAEGFAKEGADAGLFDKLDYSKIPNAQKLNDKAKRFVEEGYGPAYTQNSVQIIYNPKLVGKEITSWADLWDANLKDSVAIPDISLTYGPAMLYIAGIKAGKPVGDDKGEAAFAALEELKPNLLKSYTKSSELTNMFSTGEIMVGVGADFVFGNIKKAAPDVEMVIPTEGAFLNFNTINIVSSSKNKDLAYEFINYHLSTEAQTRTAEAIQDSPVNVDVKLADNVAATLTIGKVVETANTVDFNVVTENMKTWVDKWNNVVNKKRIVSKLISHIFRISHGSSGILKIY